MAQRAQDVAQRSRGGRRDDAEPDRSRRNGPLARLIEQPSPAETELRSFIATEEAMIKDRSRKELAEVAAKRGDRVEELQPARSAKPTRRGKWR